MRFLSATHTDVGISKKINQDAFCLKIAKSGKANIAFAVLCDGMGGLKNGELASAFLVNAFSLWFENELPYMSLNNPDFGIIKSRWNEIIQQQNKKIMNYGCKAGISLGTTVSAILAINSNYIFTQVGDSRIYKLNSQIKQLTRDQTVVEFERQQGRLTAEQAETDSRKNILLQCVGASKTVVPDFEIGSFSAGEAFMLCSDGFRHEVSDAEIIGVLSPEFLTSEKIMKKCLVDLVELNKQRNERDNITAIIIKGIN